MKLEELSASLNDFAKPFSTFSGAMAGEDGFNFKKLGEFFGGSSDFGKGLVYMIERIQETLNF